MDGDDGAGPASTEPTDTRVFVGGVPDGVGTAELSARFGRYGEVRGCKVVVHADGKANRFGYLDMKLSHAALLRMQATYANSRWKGAVVRVEVATPDYEERRLKDVADTAALDERIAARNRGLQKPRRKAEVQMRSNSHKGWVVGPGGAPLAVLRVRHPASHRVQRTKPTEVLQRHRFFDADDDSDDDVPASALTWSLPSPPPRSSVSEAAGPAVVDDDFSSVSVEVGMTPSFPEDETRQKNRGKGKAAVTAVPSDLFSSGDEADEMDLESTAVETQTPTSGRTPKSQTAVPSDLFSSDDDEAGAEEEALDSDPAADSSKVDDGGAVPLQRNQVAEEEDGDHSNALSDDDDDDDDDVAAELAKERAAQLGLVAQLSQQKQPVAATGKVVTFGKVPGTAQMRKKVAEFSSDEEDMSDLTLINTAAARVAARAVDMEDGLTRTTHSPILDSAHSIQPNSEAQRASSGSDDESSEESLPPPSPQPAARRRPVAQEDADASDSSSSEESVLDAPTQRVAKAKETAPTKVVGKEENSDSDSSSEESVLEAATQRRAKVTQFTESEGSDSEEEDVARQPTKAVPEKVRSSAAADVDDSSSEESLADAAESRAADSDSNSSGSSDAMEVDGEPPSQSTATVPPRQQQKEKERREILAAPAASRAKDPKASRDGAPSAAAADDTPKLKRRKRKAEKEVEATASNVEAVAETPAAPTFFINSSFQQSIKHQNGEIPKIGTVTSFSFFGAPDTDGSPDGEGSSAVALEGNTTEPSQAADPPTDGFAFFGPAGLLEEQPLATVAAPTPRNKAVAAAIGGGRLFGAVEDDEIEFSRTGDYAEAEQAWVETRAEMTEDYKKRRRAAKRRRTKLGLTARK